MKASHAIILKWAKKKIFVLIRKVFFFTIFLFITKILKKLLILLLTSNFLPKKKFMNSELIYFLTWWLIKKWSGEFKLFRKEERLVKGDYEHFVIKNLLSIANQVRDRKLKLLTKIDESWKSKWNDFSFFFCFDASMFEFAYTQSKSWWMKTRCSEKKCGRKSFN